METVFRIKICGITNAQDAIVVADAGAHAIGLNFYHGSPRCITIGEAIDIAAELPGSVARVGVFVNADVEHILEAAERVGLDFVQLHGDEPPEFLAQLTSHGLLLLRAFRCGPEGLPPIVGYLAECEKLHALPRAALLDAKVPGAYGGTGHVVDWESLRPQAGWIGECPILLAGGLTPENVAEAINTAHPWGVDTASGVESSPGQKNPAKVRAFVAAALAHFDDEPGRE